MAEAKVPIRQPREVVAAVRSLEAAIEEMSKDQLLATLNALAAVASRAASKVLSELDAAPVRKPDRNLSVAEAAGRLGVSKDYLYRNWRRLPFARRIGRRLLFSETGLELWNGKAARRAP